MGGKPISWDDALAQIRRLNHTCQDLAELVAKSRDLVTQSRVLLQNEAGPRPRPVRSWRFRFLLMAVGSTTLDGDDLSAADRLALEGMDHELQRRAATHGEAAAEEMLAEVIHLLEGGAPDAVATRH